MIADVLVVGGGMAGALVARALERKGREPVVVDSGEEPGGVTVPVMVDGHLLEPAAGSLMLPHPHLTPLLDGLDVAVSPAAPAAAVRLVHLGGSTHVVAPALLARNVLSLGAKLRAVAEPFVRSRSGESEDLQSFMERRFGTGVGSLGAWFAAAGVHAGDPAQLSVRAAFPGLAALEDSHGSVLGGMLVRRRSGPSRPSTHVVAGGVAAVARAVATGMGNRWRRAFTARRVYRQGDAWVVEGPERMRASRVVLAVTPERAGALLGLEVPPLPSAPVAVVWLGFERPLPAALGLLVGRHEGLSTLGFLFESSYAPDRSPAGKGLVKAIVGGAARPESVETSDQELVDRALGELGAVMGETGALETSHVIRHRPGIPQYTAERARLVERLRGDLPEGVLLAGWGCDGVGLAALATAAAAIGGRFSRGSGSS